MNLPSISARAVRALEFRDAPSEQFLPIALSGIRAYEWSGVSFGSSLVVDGHATLDRWPTRIQSPSRTPLGNSMSPTATRSTGKLPATLPASQPSCCTVGHLNQTSCSDWPQICVYSAGASNLGASSHPEITNRVGDSHRYAYNFYCFIRVIQPRSDGEASLAPLTITETCVGNFVRFRG
jgi:hypothetical protein